MVFQQEVLLEQIFPIGHHPISDQGKTYVSKKDNLKVKDTSNYAKYMALISTLQRERPL